MLAAARFLVALAALPRIASHPTYAKRGSSTAADEAAVRSYHLHVQFLAGGRNSTAKALGLRQAFVERWGDEACAGLFDQDGLCVFDVDYEPKGPFVSGNWAAYLPTESYQEVLAWITQRRGDLSILFHPNTGRAFSNVVHDHLRFATWVGRPWPLNAEALPQYGVLPLESCNEWECHFGASGGWGA
mmetsp:Transcript_10880/g.32457  ORF Transcript_10880/g.32457 Transcript_10880/m.32457 type:complete len:187 (-) Transcript_10880:53-613(-)